MVRLSPGRSCAVEAGTGICGLAALTPPSVPQPAQKVSKTPNPTDTARGENFMQAVLLRETPRVGNCGVRRGEGRSLLAGASWLQVIAGKPAPAFGMKRARTKKRQPVGC